MESVRPSRSSADQDISRRYRKQKVQDKMQKEKFLTKIKYFASPTPELCQWAKRDFQKLKHQIAKRLERFSRL